jgi:hypothetical protein
MSLAERNERWQRQVRRDRSWAARRLRDPAGEWTADQIQWIRDAQDADEDMPPREFLTPCLSAIVAIAHYPPTTAPSAPRAATQRPSEGKDRPTPPQRP